MEASIKIRSAIYMRLYIPSPVRLVQKDKKQEQEEIFAISCDTFAKNKVSLSLSLSLSHTLRPIPRCSDTFPSFRLAWIAEGDARKGFSEGKCGQMCGAAFPPGNPYVGNIKERERESISMVENNRGGGGCEGGRTNSTVPGEGEDPTIVVFCCSPVLSLFRESSVFRHPRKPRTPRISTRR